MTGPRFRGVRWALLDQGVVSGVNFLTGVLLARLLGVEGYGVFCLAWMAVLFVNSLQNALIVSPMLSIGAKQAKESEPEYFGAVLLQQFALSALSFVLVLTGVKLSAAWFPGWQLPRLALPLALVAASFQFQDFLRRYFFTVNRMVAAFLNDLVSYLGQIFGLLICFWLSLLDAASALWIIAGTSSLAAIIGLAVFGQVVFRVAAFKAVAWRHWHFSKWLTASALMYWTSGNLFIVAASAQLGPVAAGAMRAAQNIIGIAHILFQGLINVVPTEAARVLHHDGNHSLCRYLGKVAIWGGAATGLLVLAAGLAPETWLRLLYGGEYYGYGFVLRWWAIAYFLIFFGVPLTAGLRALESTRPIFLAYCMMTLFSVIAAVPAVGHFGLNGAMAGIFFCQVILQAVLAVGFWRRIHFIGLN